MCAASQPQPASLFIRSPPAKAEQQRNVFMVNPPNFLTTSLRLGGGFGGGVVVGGSGVGVVAGGDGGSGGSDSIAPAQKFWSEIAPNFFSDSLISGLMNFTTDDKKRHLVKKTYLQSRSFLLQEDILLGSCPR